MTDLFIHLLQVLPFLYLFWCGSFARINWKMIVSISLWDITPLSIRTWNSSDLQSVNSKRCMCLSRSKSFHTNTDFVTQYFYIFHKVGFGNVPGYNYQSWQRCYTLNLNLYILHSLVPYTMMTFWFCVSCCWCTCFYTIFLFLISWRHWRSIDSIFFFGNIFFGFKPCTRFL